VLRDLGYRPDWVFDQERDSPVRWRFLRPETPTMEQLICDPRIHGEPRRPLMALFSRTIAGRMAVLRMDSGVAYSRQAAQAAENSSPI